MYGEGYTFEPGKDEIVREGTAGYVVSYGVMLYRALDAVERARAAGIPVGLINKVTLNVVDEERLAQVGRSPFVLVVEDQNLYTGLGSRLGTWLLQRGHAPRYDVMAVTKPGCGGLSEHIPYQGLAPEHILERIQQMAR
jgi:transketolase C-terminal domain/subunit